MDIGLSGIGKLNTIPAKALFEHIVELRHENDEMLAATQKYGMIAQKEYMELEGRRIVLATDNLDKWLHVGSRLYNGVK